MAIRTTDAAVRAIIETQASIDTAPFIEVASALVDEIEPDSSYNATRLELIERWLAAHFYAIRDNRVASEGAGSVRQSFQYKVGLNLQVTIYGQQAAMIDTEGHLAALSKRSEMGKKKPGQTVTWLGTGDSKGNDDTE